MYLAGTPNTLVVVGFWALAARGLLHLWRGGKRFGIYSAVLVLGGIAGLEFLAISVLPRYTIVAVPFVLAWVGVGLTAPLSRAPRLARRPAAIAVPILLVALFATGPFADRGLWRSSFMHHNDFVHFIRERTRPIESTLPPLYRALAGEGPLVEYPWVGAWEVSRTPLVYQQVHGRRVLVAGGIPWLNDPRLQLRNFVWPTPEELLASDARHLVVHLAMDAEERALRPLPPNRASPTTRNLRGGAAFADRLARRWGSPHHVGKTLVAWDLERLREAGQQSRGSR